MDIFRISRNITIIAFLLSLLFHLSTVFYVFIQKKAHLFNNAERQTEQQYERQAQQEEKLRKIQQQEEWAETKARASNFGAPVFFQDTENEDPYYADAKDSKPEEQQEQLSKQDDTATSPAITEPEELPEENNPAEENTQEQNALEVNEVALQERMQSTPAEPIKKRTNAKKRARKPRMRKTNNSAFGSAGPTRPPLSLAQLTQGFMHHLKDEGKYAVSMLGNKSGRPTEEQLKYERYLQKLGWCLQNAYNINSDRCPAIPHDTTTHVNLILNRDGTTRHVAISKSSQNLHLDAFTLSIFRDAASSFPPVPDYLKVDPFAITYVITVGASDGKNMRFYQR